MRNRIGVSEFVTRQTPESPYSHFDGSWSELVMLVAQRFQEGWYNVGYKEGVVLVSMPPERFLSSTIEVKPGAPLRAVFEARRAGEAPFLSVRARGEKTPAKHAYVVLYAREVLQEGNEATVDADYEIVSINARCTEQPEPMDPMTMARNFLCLPGGTKGEFTAQQFAESIVYWSTHALMDSTNK